MLDVPASADVILSNHNADVVDSALQSAAWQEELRQSVSDVHQLCELLELPADFAATMQDAQKKWPLRVPRGFLARMRKSDPHDPLLLQVLPAATELQTLPGYSSEPLQEHRFNPQTGVLHKYQGRVLLVLTGSCAVHCRYCFRREFDYQAQSQSRAVWHESLAYIRHNQDISEVILSGGDPLMLSDQHLRWLSGELQAIPHISTLRIHTRLPVVLPSRISPGLLQVFSEFRGKIVVVVHSNHANELNEPVGNALAALKAHDVLLLNQSVLLKGVNDSVQALRELSLRLFDYGVLPYYVHRLDKVAGSHPFYVDRATTGAIQAELASSLPGYLLPQFVYEEPGANAKQAFLV